MVRFPASRFGKRGFVQKFAARNAAQISPDYWAFFTFSVAPPNSTGAHASKSPMFTRSSQASTGNSTGRTTNIPNKIKGPHGFTGPDLWRPHCLPARRTWHSNARVGKAASAFPFPPRTPPPHSKTWRNLVVPSTARQRLGAVRWQGGRGGATPLSDETGGWSVICMLIL